MENEKLIFSKDTIEFVTVAVRFCAFLEQTDGMAKSEFLSTLLKMMPLMYMKAQMLPEIESEGDFLPAPQVTEGDYEWVRSNVFQLLQDDDQYLDFCDEHLQTDETQWKSVSEHLADVYQPVRNFLAVYQGGIEDCMNDALWALEDSFRQYWGQALVDAMKQMHRVAYRMKEPEEEEDYE